VSSPTPAPAPARRNGAATRQRLLRAAAELYTTIGYRATTTPELAARAGVAEGTIYRHFTGKEDLLNEVYRDAQRRGADLVREVDTDRALPPRERLLGIARRLILEAKSDAARMRMLLQSREERLLDEESRAVGRDFQEALHQIVASGKSDGLVRAGPADLWAAVWLALVAFAAERVSAGEWTPEHPQVGMTLDAAWDAISTTKGERG
jgi:TetR/AcrR family transcriptional regulator, repressor of fatR-cypB operon